MNTFLELNRDKLKSIFVRLSLVLLGLASIVLSVAYLTESFPNGQLLLAIILATGIVFPFLIMLIGYIVWLLSHKARQKAFSKIPFNEIEKIGFYKAYKGESSKWSFTNEIKEGRKTQRLHFKDGRIQRKK